MLGTSSVEVSDDGVTWRTESCDHIEVRREMVDATDYGDTFAITSAGASTWVAMFRGLHPHIRFIRINNTVAEAVGVETSSAVSGGGMTNATKITAISRMSHQQARQSAALNRLMAKAKTEPAPTHGRLPTVKL